MLHTERLTLRPLRVEDAEALHGMFHDPIAMRYWHTSPHRDVAATRKALAKTLIPRACQWAICRRDDDTAIGIIGYLDTDVPIPGMGYALAPAFWRTGVMTEAGRAALDYGFTQLGLDRVELWVHQGNIASQRLARALGFTRRGQFRRGPSNREGAHDTLVFGLFRWEWQGATADPRIPRFDAVRPELTVADVAAALACYRDQLGFVVAWHSGETPDSSDYVIITHRDWMATGACFHVRRAGAGEAIAPSGIVLTIELGSDIDALYAAYVDKGVHVVEPPTSRPWGVREFEVADADGYRLRFTAPC